MNNTLRLSTLTYLAFELNTALDQGHGHAISIEQVETGIESSNVLGDVQKILREVIDLSLIVGTDQEAPLIDVLIGIQKGLSGRTKRKLGVKNSGMCLLMAYVLEAIQRQADQHPLLT